jgi:hypothetical protein
MMKLAHQRVPDIAAPSGCVSKCDQRICKSQRWAKRMAGGHSVFPSLLVNVFFDLRLRGAEARLLWQ